MNFDDGCHNITYVDLNGEESSANRGGELQIFTSDGVIYYLTLHKTPSKYNCDFVKASGGNICDLMGQIRIDVNGIKAPNTTGRDFFVVNVDNSGTLYPHGAISGFGESDWWKRTSGGDNTRCLDNNQGYGDACAARIIESGWKMDY